MDELTMLRDVWPEPDAPTEEARTAARTALLNRAEPRRRARIRLPRAGVRLAMVGGLAIAITATMTIGLTSLDDRSKVPGVPGGPVANAAEVLDRAAAAAEHRPFKQPRSGQWIYTRYKNVPVKQRWSVRGNPGSVPSVRIFEEQWTRADGKRSAFLDGGRLHVQDLSDPRSRTAWPPSDYAGLAALPTDPDKLLALMRSRIGTERPAPRQAGCRFGIGVEFWVFEQILLGSLLPPKVEASVYRAMKRLPGIVVNRAAGPNGRPEIALGRYENGWQLNEVLFDARTYRFVGSRSTAVKDPNEIIRRCQSLGTDGLNMRIVQTGIVNKAGQRP